MSLALKRRDFLLGALTFSGLHGCGNYKVKNLAKSDINLVTDEFIAETRGLVADLMVKLYRRNPDQLLRGDLHTMAGRLTLIRETRGALRFEELSNLEEIEALDHVFDPGFQGDRVFLLIVGLGGMLRRAYGYNTELYMFDSLNPEVLEASARNTEILLWRLKNNRKPNGDLFLITSEYQGVIDNLSFERLFGKLIALQDMMARIASDADDRRVTKAVHTATSVFIPLPI
ncbi:MAG: hypothetical protein AAGG55_07485 [Pseudomonadota bacterium]